MSEGAVVALLSHKEGEDDERVFSFVFQLLKIYSCTLYQIIIKFN